MADLPPGIESRDLYAEMGVPPDFTDQQLKKAYRARALEVHPDRPGGDGERMRLIIEAHGVLRDPVKRGQYREARASHLQMQERWAALKPKWEAWMAANKRAAEQKAEANKRADERKAEAARKVAEAFAEAKRKTAATTAAVRPQPKAGDREARKQAEVDAFLQRKLYQAGPGWGVLDFVYTTARLVQIDRGQQ